MYCAQGGVKYYWLRRPHLLFFYGSCLLFFVSISAVTLLQPFASLPKCLGGFSLSSEHENYHFQLSFSGHTYTKCLFCYGTVQGRCSRATKANGTPLRAHASESAWLHLPGLLFCCVFFLYRLIQSSTLFPAALVLPYTSSMGVDVSMCSLIFSGSISFDLASVLHQLFIFPSISFQQIRLLKDHEPPVLAPHIGSLTWPQLQTKTKDPEARANQDLLQIHYWCILGPSYFTLGLIY